MSNESDPVAGFHPVLLECAFAGTCPRCTKRNFVDAEEFEPGSEEELREVLEDLGVIESWQELPEQTSRLFSAPPLVACSSCGAIYPAVERDSEDDDEDPDPFGR